MFSADLSCILDRGVGVMRILKICLVTLLVLEVLAIVVHFNELLSYTGNIVSAFMPIFIVAAAIVWLLQKIF